MIKSVYLCIYAISALYASKSIESNFTCLFVNCVGMATPATSFSLSVSVHEQSQRRKLLLHCPFRSSELPCIAFEMTW
ncbi:hypothetical protein ACOSP7_021334 [Xanthoceras sorbifolium]